MPQRAGTVFLWDNIMAALPAVPPFLAGFARARWGRPEQLQHPAGLHVQLHPSTILVHCSPGCQPLVHQPWQPLCRPASLPSHLSATLGLAAAPLKAAADGEQAGQRCSLPQPLLLWVLSSRRRRCYLPSLAPSPALAGMRLPTSPLWRQASTPWVSARGLALGMPLPARELWLLHPLPSHAAVLTCTLAHGAALAGVVQLRNELSSSFGVELPPTVTFDYPTPAALARFMAQHGQGAGVPSAAAAPTAPLAEPAAAAQGPGAAPEAAPAARLSAEDVAASVATIVATVLGTEVAADEPLMAAGLDSLGQSPSLAFTGCACCHLHLLLLSVASAAHAAGAIQLRNAITERFGVELPVTAALDFPTITALAAFVAQSLAPAATQSSTGVLVAAANLAASVTDELGEQRLPCKPHMLYCARRRAD